MELKAVADAEEQFSLRNEAGKLFGEFFPRRGDARVEDAIGSGLGRAQIIAVEKPAGEIEKVVVVQAALPV